MNLLKKVAPAIVLITLFASCQSNTDVKEILTKRDTRKEMRDAMINSKNSRLPMMQYSTRMIKMMKDNSGMRQSMMPDMMEIAKSDTTMLSGMFNTMKGNPQLIDMMLTMKGKNMNIYRIKYMNKMDDKTHY